jgi:phosphatidylinositol alpha-1,6-mannosyltransferase
MFRERPKAVQLATVSDGSFGLWLNEWFNLPFVVYAHGNEILSALRGDCSRAFITTMKRAERILAVSRFTGQLVQQLGIDSSRIEIVHPGCDVDRFQPRPSRNDLRQKLLGRRTADQVILTVGTLVERKGHDLVIRSLQRLRQTVPDVTYLIVGTGPHRTQLETLARNSGVLDRVVFVGQVSVDELIDIYALSDVFVMPSRERPEANDVEGFGLVFLEASACAKPIVSTWSGGVPDAVVDGITGLLVDPLNPEELAGALSRLLLDKNLATRMGQQGRARVVNEFSWNHVGERVHGIIETVAGKR